MKRSERLDVVQQAAARTERERAERVGAAERHLAEMQQKLTALEKYRNEYETGFAAKAGAPNRAVNRPRRALWRPGSVRNTRAK